MSHDENSATSVAADEPQLYGMLAEFDSVGCLLHAAKAMKKAGFTKWDCFTPFPVHRLDEAMGNRPTRLARLVFVCGVAGCLGGLGLVMWTMASSVEAAPNFLQGYMYNISGKPFASLPAYIPVIFETTILLSAFGAVFGMLGANKLPQLYHPLFKKEAFRRATDDRFFIAVEADDPKFDAQEVPRLLTEAGALNVDTVED
jgi:hypothetical protein